MDPKLAGQTAIVTGGASGIGRATAKLLIAEGVKVIIADMQEEKGNEVVFDIKSNGGEALFVQVNVASKDDAAKMMGAALAAYGQVDMLFNIAGPGAVGGQLDTEENEWDRQMNGHLKGVFNCTKAVLPHGRTQKRQNCEHGFFCRARALDGIPAYCAAFGGIIAYTKCGEMGCPLTISISIRYRRAIFLLP